MNKLPKLLIIGHGRHGKDTVSEIISSTYNYKFENSSRFCSKLFIYDKFKNKYNYKNEVECFNDRHNRRQEWYDAISEYNTPDAARLGKEIFKKNNIYCGLRKKNEFEAMVNDKVFDYSIWVDRTQHLPKEDITSMTLNESMADFIVDNNGSLEDLKYNTINLMEKILRNQV